MTREIIGRNLLALVLVSSAISLAGCGGGGGNSVDSNNSTVLPTTGNVQPLAINSGPRNNAANALYTSVTICAPGGVNCQVIDHILVDTGSAGLRIMASALPSSLALPAQTVNAPHPLIECTHFVAGFTWGPIKLADVKMAGEQANSVPIQVIDDSGFAEVPDSCSSIGTGISLNNIAALRANGILGISVFKQDWGTIATLTPPISGFYYICPLTGCQPIAVSRDKQVQNPVSMFATNKNGVIISLPSIRAQGEQSVSGSLIFGIGTQVNNGIGNANIIPVNMLGNFVTTFNGKNYDSSFIDSGSNGIFFPLNIFSPGPDIIICDNKFYCPTSDLKFSVINHGNKESVVDFTVANADLLFRNNPSFTAFNSLAGHYPDGFDFGLSFFYGRNIYTAIEGMDTGGGNIGPYVAY